MKERKVGRSKPVITASASSSQSSGVSSTSTSQGGKNEEEISNELKLKEMLSELRTMISNIQDERNKSEQTLSNIAKMKEKISQEKTRSSSGTTQLKVKLKSQCGVAYQEAEKEFDLINKALQHIEEIKQVKGKGGKDKPKQILRRGVLMSLLQKNAATLPLWIGKPKEEPPHLCGAVQAETHHVCQSGDKVAARVKSADDAEENWILAEVVSYNSSTNKYDVDDIDAEEGKERHTLSKRRITPLPLWKVDPETNPECLFAKGALVLALYPQTTCFYRALVHIQPTKVTEDYCVLFEDTSYPNGYSPPLNVSQRYVISCKDDKKK